jgi:hypothetical protein
VIRRGAALLAGLTMAAAVALLVAGALLGDNAMHVRRVPPSQRNELPHGEDGANLHVAAARRTRPNELSVDGARGRGGPLRGGIASQPNELLFQQVVVTARDSVSLSGRFLPLDHAGRARCAIALHGIGDHGGNALWLARMLAEGGYSALLADSRAHGQSGGELATSTGCWRDMTSPCG